MMTFNEFHNNHPELTYLVAKIYYNLEQERQSRLKKFVVEFSNETNYGVCESCSA